MYSLTSASRHLRSEECSSSSNKILLPRSCLLKAVGNHDCSSLPSLATEEDDEVHFDTSDTDSHHEVLLAGRRDSSVQEFASAIPNHLLMGSLLELLCFVYESNPARSRTLFKVIGQRLASMNLLSPLAISDEFSTVRLQHNRAFTELLNAVSSSPYSLEQQSLNINTHNPALRQKERLFQAQTSRYLSEFEEIGRIGKGSYGNVYKVLNKLDGQCYAVKKILIKKVSKEDCMKVLREVKVLSSLQHVNIVGYHTAWMEHVQSTTYAENRLPELATQEDISDEDLDSSSSSYSVVFQSRSQPQVNCSSNAAVPPSNGPPGNPLALTQEKGQEACPSMMRRIPENYVPCVFLGQRGPIKTSKCPAVGWDTSGLLEEESSNSGIEVNNNSSCVEKKCEQYSDNKQMAKPAKEVRLHLMLYIQMQLCERSLKDWMTERNSKPKEEQISRCPYGCVNAENTFSLLRKILEGVEYIHTSGIIHRDLKPRNIFLNGHDCHVRIGDFGLACSGLILNNPESVISPTDDSPHTTGVGTFVYAAPEQLRSSHYDSKSDMYSIGVLALELFQPFGTEMERVRTLGDLREGKISESFSNRWPVLANYISKLTSIEPGTRPTASQLLQSELFCSKDVVICGLKKKVAAQEEEIHLLRKQIQRLQSSHSTFQNCQSWEDT
ncbi:eukaryotic translation initiation factor 2-alpha kinase 1 isoform X1 [Syngnathus acus]|uniref:eukaryotic translation initiation factor 2-alpha kinase 1 isoform X1 n=1 Tax=Syngnathus acus TaxID=161584 RepID=UPI001885F52F|nr:eukaryotic translation initiation factor 2-alpha kinase 1 isoform X1 [Syngnathus acus]